MSWCWPQGLPTEFIPPKNCCTGLPLEYARKSAEPTAARLAPDNVRRMHQSLHQLVADAPWNDEDVSAQVRSCVSAAIGGGHRRSANRRRYRTDGRTGRPTRERGSTVTLPSPKQRHAVKSTVRENTAPSGAISSRRPNGYGPQIARARTSRGLDYPQTRYHMHTSTHRRSRHARRDLNLPVGTEPRSGYFNPRLQLLVSESRPKGKPC
jgi:hypothetical protein